MRRRNAIFYSHSPNARRQACFNTDTMVKVLVVTQAEKKTCLGMKALNLRKYDHTCINTKGTRPGRLRQLSSSQQDIWRDPSQCHLYFRELATKLGITDISEPKNWYSIGLSKIKKHGGAQLLASYNDSLPSALKVAPCFLVVMVAGSLSTQRVVALEVP